MYEYRITAAAETGQHSIFLFLVSDAPGSACEVSGRACLSFPADLAPSGGYQIGPTSGALPVQEQASLLR